MGKSADATRVLQVKQELARRLKATRAEVARLQGEADGMEALLKTWTTQTEPVVLALSRLRCIQPRVRGPRPRGTCPECGSDVSLSTGGVVFYHGSMVGARGCTYTGLPKTVEATDGAEVVRWCAGRSRGWRWRGDGKRRRARTV
jgi:hypothetical protein